MRLDRNAAIQRGQEADLRISFIDSPEFYEADADSRILVPLPHRPAQELVDDPELGPIFSKADVLTAQEQFECGRMMNYLKFKATRSTVQDETATLLKLATECRDLLIVSSLRLVKWAVNRFRSRLRPSEDYRDMFDAGVTAMHRSVELWDFRLGVKFSTYVAKALIWECSHWLQRERRHSKSTVQFSDESSDDGFLIDQVESRETKDLINTTSAAVHAKALVRKLPGREREFIELYFGLAGQPQSASEIAVQFELTSSRVNQIINSALNRLRTSVANNLPEDSPELKLLQKSYTKRLSGIDEERSRRPIPNWLLMIWAESSSPSLGSDQRVVRIAAEFEQRSSIERHVILRWLLQIHDMEIVTSEAIGTKERRKLLNGFPEWLARLWNVPTPYDALAKEWGRKFKQQSEPVKRAVLSMLLSLGIEQPHRSASES